MLVATDENLGTDIGIDETWQKRGHCSLNGLIISVARENKKVIDYKVFRKFCKSGALWGSKKGLWNILSGKRIMGKVVKLITSSLLEPWNLLTLSLFYQSPVAKYIIRYLCTLYRRW